MVGSEREGLHSLFKRTCEKNQLTVNDVFSNLLLPKFGTHPASPTKMNADVHLLNRGGVTSNRLITCIHEFVTLPDLSGFTLRELTELQGIGALSVAHDRKWCNACFAADLTSELGPYDRLLWSIDDVKICPIHSVHLKNICPICGGGPFRILLGRDISGHCPECFSWLGGFPTTLEVNRDEHTQFLFWMAKSFADLLDSPLPSQFDVGRCVIEVLRALANNHYNGKYAPLAKAVERNQSVICTWLKGSSSPSWRSLLEISYVFQLPLSEILLGQFDGISISEIHALPLAAVPRLTHPKKLPESRDAEKIKTFLESTTNGEIPNLTTLQSVADRLNINVRDLRRIAPAESLRLSQVLAKRRKLLQERKRNDRQRMLQDEIPSLVSKMLDEGSVITQRELYLNLTKIGISVRRDEDPFVKKIVGATRVLREMKNISGNT